MNATQRERRDAILKFITDYWNREKMPPSYRQIGEAVDIPSTSTVSKDVHALIEEGKLTMATGKYRSLRPAGPLSTNSWTDRPAPTAPMRDDVYDIPRYGSVAAGAPIYADDTVESMVPLPSTFFPNDGSDYFILDIHGDSMMDAGILDGDHVIVRKQNTAKNGEQVVALIEDSATVKTFYRHADHIELRPENMDYAPIIVKECLILGVVLGLYRLY